MTDFLNGRFYISISTKPIEDKNKDIWGNITYSKQHIRLSELRDYISNNYAFCGVFTSDTFSVSDKTESNWMQTNIICLDLDERKLAYTDFMALIQDSDVCPNIAYRTTNDGIKGNRYRLIYALDDAIVNCKLYSQIYWGIVRKIEELTNDKNTDNCCQSVAQQICGTPHKDDIYFNDLYYDVKCFKEMFGIRTLNISDLYERQRNKDNRTKKVSVRKSFVGFDFSDYSMMYDEFSNDFNTLSFTDIVKKYNGKYFNYECTQLPLVSEDSAYIEIPSYYCEIKRYWYLEESAINNNKCSNIRKIKDGQQRRKKLYVNAIIRRLIYDDITFDNLLYNLVFELYSYMINDGNKITKSDLFEICKRAFNADLSLPKYQKYIIGNKEKKYIVNTAYCVKHNVSKKQAVRIAEKQRTYNTIRKYYDLDLKDKENVKVMKENGIKVSLRTLQNWKKENNISKWDKVQKQTINIKEKERNIYNCNCTFGTSENDIVLQCHEKGYTIRQIADITNISKSKVFRIIKANNQNKVSYQTINIKEKERNIYTCNDTFSNDVINEEYKSNNTNDEVRVKGIKRVYAIRRKRPITSETKVLEESENNVIKAL